MFCISVKPSHRIVQKGIIFTVKIHTNAIAGSASKEENSNRFYFWTCLTMMCMKAVSFFHVAWPACKRDIKLFISGTFYSNTEMRNNITFLRLCGIEIAILSMPLHISAMFANQYYYVY